MYTLWKDMEAQVSSFTESKSWDGTVRTYTRTQRTHECVVATTYFYIEGLLKQ